MYFEHTYRQKETGRFRPAYRAAEKSLEQPSLCILAPKRWSASTTALKRGSPYKPDSPLGTALGAQLASVLKSDLRRTLSGVGMCQI